MAELRGRREGGREFPTEGTMTREELDQRNLGNRQLAGSSVEVVSDASDERVQEVQVRSMPYSMETPEQFRKRVENEED